MRKNIFVVIVTYNGAQWLEKCIQSLEASLYPINILVVDNHSTDTSVSVVKSFSKVQLIESDGNLGFGKANNIGIRKAIKQGADYVFLLNQDTWIYPDTIQNLVAVAEQNPKYGIVSPMHFSADEVTLDSNFDTYYNRKTNTLSSLVDQVPFVNAAAWMLSSKVIEKVGDFEPLFEHYGEDRNYSDRVRFHGFKTVVVKNAKICHDRFISRSFSKDVKQAKFKMLAEVLNVNHAWIPSYFYAFKNVVGLPKYFSKYYSFSQVCSMFFSLFGYYILLKLRFITILKARKSYR
ncbi:glycosyltransferase family 2 protein [Flavobacterium chuncheonense]|uniref:Glycosyltransferase family 2 protein n=1 Tax=Flavobacterium chuncheonense TaxID=2026653 RepID=A0ABW5YK59_9FLAO